MLEVGKIYKADWWEEATCLQTEYYFLVFSVKKPDIYVYDILRSDGEFIHECPCYYAKEIVDLS